MGILCCNYLYGLGWLDRMPELVFVDERQIAAKRVVVSLYHGHNDVLDSTNRMIHSFDACRIESKAK